MKIIPVIDIKNHIAVAAIKGERDKYKPLKSIISKSPDPIKVAESYKNSGFSEVYIADLDSILHSKPNLETLIKINEIIPVTADIGVKTLQDIKLLKNTNIEIVIGTETLPSFDFLTELNELNHSFILSIDIKNNKLINNLNLNLDEFIEKISNGDVKTKIDKIIILDLSRVGTGEGPNIELCKKLIAKLKNKKIIYGGGVKNEDDIKKLRKCNLYGILVGNAIHSGNLNFN